MFGHMSQASVPHDIHVVASWPEFMAAGEELRLGPTIVSLCCKEILGVQNVF